MKKILFIASEFPPLPGGIGTHALHLSSGLTDVGYDVTVFTNSRDISSTEKQFDDSLSFPVHRTPRTYPLITYLSRVTTLLSLVKKNRPTVLLASGKFSLWLGGLLSFFYPSISKIAIIHGTELLAGGICSRWLTKQSLKRFDRYVAVSHYTKLQLNKLLPNCAITVITNGVVLPEMNKQSIKKENTLKLVTVGNVSPRKGQHNVIKALPLLLTLYPELHYSMIGFPTIKSELEKLAKDLHVNHHISFEGVLSEEEKCTAVASSALFLMLSEHLPNGDFEGFGIAVLEANALGIPAIGAVNSGIADAIVDKKTGRLVDPHDPEAIKRAIKKILADYENYSTQARAWASANKWPQVIAKYKKVLDL